MKIKNKEDLKKLLGKVEKYTDKDELKKLATKDNLKKTAKKMTLKKLAAIGAITLGVGILSSFMPSTDKRETKYVFDQTQRVWYGEVKGYGARIGGEENGRLFHLDLRFEDDSKLVCYAPESNRLFYDIKEEMDKDGEERVSDLEKATGHWNNGKFYMETFEINSLTFKFGTVLEGQVRGLRYDSAKDMLVGVMLEIKEKGKPSHMWCNILNPKEGTLAPVRAEIEADYKELNQEHDLEKVTGFWENHEFYMKTFEINDKTFRFD